MRAALCMRASMMREIAAAVGFIAKFLRSKGLRSEWQLQTFSQSLQELLAGECGRGARVVQGTPPPVAGPLPPAARGLALQVSSDSWRPPPPDSASAALRTRRRLALLARHWASGPPSAGEAGAGARCCGPAGTGLGFEPWPPPARPPRVNAVAQSRVALVAPTARHQLRLMLAGPPGGFPSLWRDKGMPPAVQRRARPPQVLQGFSLEPGPPKAPWAALGLLARLLRGNKGCPDPRRGVDTVGGQGVCPSPKSSLIPRRFSESRGLPVVASLLEHM